MNRHFAALTVLFAVLVASSLPAAANTISTSSQSFSMSSTGSDLGVPGQSEILNFTQFNSALGTLTGVTVAGTGLVSLSGATLGNCGVVSITLTPKVGSVSLTPITASADFGSGDFCGAQKYSGGGSTTFNVTAPGSLGAYIGTGTAPITFSYTVTTSGEQGSDSASWSGSANLVYTYTPVSTTVPEPSSIFLIATGVAAIAGSVRRKLGR